jgi:metal-responsive CopG/Arc/MetJ family transcriptional regulator
MARRRVGEPHESTGKKRAVLIKLDRDLVTWLDVFAARRDMYRSEGIEKLLQWARGQIEPKEEKGQSPL